MSSLVHTVARVASSFNPRKIVYVDTETTGLNPWFGDQPFAVSMCDEKGNPWYCEWPVHPFTRQVTPDKRSWETVAELMSDPSFEKRFYNAKFDVRMLEKVGIDVIGTIIDVFFKARVFNTLEWTYRLKSLAWKYCKFPIDDEKELKAAVVKCRREAKKLGWKLHDSPLGDYWMPRALDPENRLCERYAVRDAQRTLCLDTFYSGALSGDEDRLETLEREMKIWPIVYEMEDRGVRIDTKENDKHLRDNQKRAWHHLVEMREMIKGRIDPVPPKSKDRKFNPSSPQQLVKVLFDPEDEGGYGLEPLMFTKPSKAFPHGQPSTTWKALRQYEAHPFVRVLFIYRGATKACNTFFGKYKKMALPDHIDRGGKCVHPSFNQCQTKTARFSCVAKGTMIEVVRDVSQHARGIPIEDVKSGDLAYTYDRNQNLTLKPVQWAGMVGTKKVVRVHWTMQSRSCSGFVDLTPDHMVMMTDGSWVHAVDLEYGDRVMALHRSDAAYGYTRIWPVGDREYRDHDFIYEQLHAVKPSYQFHVHHKDENKKNNLPGNLEGLTPKDHFSYHARNMTDEQRQARKRNGGRNTGKHYNAGKNNRSYRHDITKKSLLRAFEECDGKLTYVMSMFGADYETITSRCKEYGIQWNQLPRRNNHIIDRVEILPGKVDVYDLEIKDTHNFIAGEICVHNCNDPNLQQAADSRGFGAVQARGPFGPRIKHVWLCFDYAQQEGRIFAEVSQLPDMVDAFVHGRDLATELANKAWGGKGNPYALQSAAYTLELGNPDPQNSDKIAPAREALGWSKDKCRLGANSPEAYAAADRWLAGFNYDVVLADASVGTTRTRTRAKIVFFAKIFGGGPSAVKDLLYCSLRKAKETMDQFEDQWPGITPFVNKMAQIGLRQGYIQNLWGRKLSIEPDYSYRATNYLVQGTAADQMKQSMINVYDYIQENGVPAYPIMTVHDELVLEVEEEAATPSMVRDVIDIMQDSGGRIKSVPVKVECKKVTTRWDLKKSYFEDE